tara:strand:- start:1232 stop:1969 length:738 start_codon:yes stop_codon:yes gene_type:complete
MNTQKKELVVTDIKKQYKGRFVVNGINLCLKQGEIIGLLGPNGAGKTTTFYMIVGLVNSDAGCITLGEDELTHLPMDKRAKKGIGYLPQEASVFRKMTVEQNLLAILELDKNLSRKERKQRANDLLEAFHITHIRTNLGLSLSGGERRRLEIARAIALNPAFILLDEPFAGVDPISVLDIKKIIRQLSDRGIGVLITDHNVRETLSLCDRAYIVSQGKVLCEGDAQTIIANPEVRASYLGNEFTL